MLYFPIFFPPISAFSSKNHIVKFAYNERKPFMNKAPGLFYLLMHL